MGKLTIPAALAPAQQTIKGLPKPIFVHVHAKCEHAWNGEPVDIGNGWSASCSKCGVTAFAVSIREGL